MYPIATDCVSWPRKCQDWFDPLRGPWRATIASVSDTSYEGREIYQMAIGAGFCRAGGRYRWFLWLIKTSSPSDANEDVSYSPYLPPRTVSRHESDLATLSFRTSFAFDSRVKILLLLPNTPVSRINYYNIGTHVLQRYLEIIVG